MRVTYVLDHRGSGSIAAQTVVSGIYSFRALLQRNARNTTCIDHLTVQSLEFAEQQFPDALMQWIVTLVDLAQNPGDEHAAASAADVGYCGAMHLESRLQTGWECEKRGCLPFFRRIPVATDSDCVECDDQQLAYQRGTVIHVPILVRSGEGYGKLLKVDFHDSACDSHLGTNEQVDGPVRRDRYLD